MVMQYFQTKNFKMSELTASNTARRLGIDNTHLTDAQYDALVHLILCVLQPVRERLGFPITVTSGFRCPALNKTVGGVPNSQHMRGEAADLRCFTNKQFDPKKTRALFAALADMDIDQLLYERDSKGSIWVHVSYVSPSKNRHMIRDNYLVK